MEFKEQKIRCAWPGLDPLMIQYHDEEWGVPLHDDQKLFEFLILDTFQAGLSWRTILHKRNHFTRAFDNFNPHQLSVFGEKEVEQLMLNKHIIRNRLKINAAITNACHFLQVQKEFGTFNEFIWQFTDGKVIQNNRLSPMDIPTHSKESDQMSKALKQKGFKFVGTTICYAFMQAAGMVNDHLTTCFRHAQITE